MKKWLCKIGLHKWVYWTHEFDYRTCSVCELQQALDH